MRRSFGKRLLSLTLALEMLCSPLAIARAEDPARIREEIPMGEEARPVQASSADDLPISGETIPEASDGTGSQSAAPSGGTAEGAQLLSFDEEFHMAISYGMATDSTGKITYYDHYFDQEAATAAGQWGATCDSVDRLYDHRVTMEVNGEYLYFYLPDMGRIPDQELEGLYIYKNAATVPGGNDVPPWLHTTDVNKGSDIMSWVYDKDCTALPFEEVPADQAPELPKLDGSGTLVRTKLTNVTDALDNGVQRYDLEPVDANLGVVWCVPLVARWKSSGDSGINMFALDVASTEANSVTQVEAVTELYTKSFREAGENDRLTAEAYTADYQAQTQEELDAGTGSHGVRRQATVFRPASGQAEQHFYLRVKEDQDEVTLRFLTQEPYFTYFETNNQGIDPPVSVSATFFGKDGKGGEEEVDLQATVQPEWAGWEQDENGKWVWVEDNQHAFPCPLVYGPTRNAQNGVDLPARGQWTLAKIPLNKVSDAYDPVNKPFTVITVTVTSPDGKSTSTYVFHIERLMTPQAALGVGNTPAGMIARDDSSLWQNEVDWGEFATTTVDPAKDRKAYNKASARYYFSAQRTFKESPIVPQGSANQNGAIYMGDYNTLAWTGISSIPNTPTNPDLDPGAVVAYQDMVFDDPGVSFVDSEGRNVVFGAKASEEYKNCVTRKLELATPLDDAPLTVDLYGAGGTKCWYALDETGKPYLTTDPDKAAQTLRERDGSDPVDLRGLHVLPGIYTATYTFKDPVISGEPTVIQRRVVVLPIPGDVDMDGAVTAADAAAMEANETQWSADTAYRLLRNRVYTMGVGPGGKSKYLNAETIRQGFQPVLGNTEALGYSDYMYLPLPYTGEDTDYHARRTWEQVTPLEGAGATLRLDFLGVEQGTWRKVEGETYTSDISGPWGETPEGQGVSIVADSSATSGTGDVFWMGVYVEGLGAEMSGRPIKDLSLSLIYDSEYVRPATVYSKNEGAGYDNDALRWQQTTLVKYNLREGAFDGETPKTIFADRTGDDYTYSNSVYDRSYATHYSKVKGGLELAYTDQFDDRLNSNKLKEVVFSLQAKEGTRATLQEGYLLVLPFQLIRHPDARMKEGGAQLIELSAGMRDFSLVLEPKTGRGLFSLFSAGSENTYAFSAQDAIYGDATQNLRESLTYDGTTSLVPIGEDNTQREILKNASDGEDAVYDEPFRVVNLAFNQGTVSAGSLPPGLTFDPVANQITGSPTRAGTYDFTIRGVPYQIIVRKKTISYQVMAVQSFYGETEFRGYQSQRDGTQRNFTFSYDRTALAQRDRDTAKTIFGEEWKAEGRGTGKELAQILRANTGTEYQEPFFYARNPSTLNPVEQKTSIGKYDILLENPRTVRSTNYELKYNSTGSGQLTIERRPVWVDHIEMTAEQSGARIYNDERGQNETVTVEETPGGPELIFLDYYDFYKQSDESVSINGQPLTGPAKVAGDCLGLEFNADFVMTEKDLAYQATLDENKLFFYDLDGDEEERDLENITVYSPNDLLGPDRSNYELRGLFLLNADACKDKVKGTVVRRGVESIRITRYPGILRRDENNQPLRTLTYGNTNTDDISLFVEVTRGAGAGEATVVGEYVYNNPLLRPMELHYNWVSPTERQKGLDNPNTLDGTGWDPGDKNNNGKEDECPYNGTDIFTPAMDGYYLCVAVKKYEANVGNTSDSQYIKVYSDHPIQVTKRTITLEAQPMTRFYGDSNQELAYHYEISDMRSEDWHKLEEWVKEDKDNTSARPTQTGEEMERFFREVLKDPSFVAPTLVTSKTPSVPKTLNDQVLPNTPVGGGKYYIILRGGSSTNYTFAYRRSQTGGTGGTEIVSGPGAFGVSSLTVNRRPVVVQEVRSPKNTLEDFETIYADTKNLYLTNQEAGVDRLSFTLPESDSQANTTTFYRAGTGGMETVLRGISFEEGTAAIHPGDDLRVRYSVRFMCDQGHARWLGFSNNYYDVDTLIKAGGQMQKEVVISDLALTGNAAGNYELVYSSAQTASYQVPDSAKIAYYPGQETGLRTFYLVQGTGAVTLRKIEKLTLESVGKTQYIYGDEYAPYGYDADGDETPMVVAVQYETAEDVRHNNSDYENNIHAEKVTYQVAWGSNAFADRGFLIYYMKPGQTPAQAIAAGQTIDHTTFMTPGEHQGAQIFVTGSRREGDPLIISGASTEKLQVAQRKLTFTVRDAHRFYGETFHVNEGDEITDEYIGTTAFTYSFPMSQLAKRDRDKLAKLKGVETLPELGTEEDLKLLEASGWHVGLPALGYTPDPGVTAELNEQQGKSYWGEYEIAMFQQETRAPEQGNYEVTGEPGTLYVYPRPIWVQTVQSGPESPVYTIYNQTNRKSFLTQLTTEAAEGKAQVVVARDNHIVLDSTTVDRPNQNQMCRDNIYRSLPLSGQALVGDDQLVFDVRLLFYGDWDLSEGVADYAQPQVQLTFRNVRASEIAKNYVLSNVSTTEAATFRQEGFYGAVKLRTIDEIFITGRPNTQYAYGETLDLTGLQVTIRYKAQVGEGVGEVNVADYIGPDDFRAYGLYLNYWYPEDAVPGGFKPNCAYNEKGEPIKNGTTTTEGEDEARKTLPNRYRRADTGDHLTIAPTHDTQQYIGKTSQDPLRRPFAANGKYLIVSACQPGEKQTAAVPKILGDKVMTTVGEAYEKKDAPIAIQVTPMQLQYTVSAADKTYDGNPDAAGTLTLQNIFDAEAQVKTEDVADGSGDPFGVQSMATSALIRDVVYVPMGAAYEDHGEDHSSAGYDGYRALLQNGTAAFTTGTYQPNGEAPLQSNGKINWAAGYTWGKGLTFTFVNSNVHYLEKGETEPRGVGTQEQADYWRQNQSHNAVTDQWDAYGTVCAMPVEVTNMVIQGPDAANYTWAPGGQADIDTEVTMTNRSGDAPYATIHKANRSTIQDLAGQGLSLPKLQADEHTNVVRLLYDQDLTKLKDNNNHNQSREDEFRDELHFEYALYYEKDGLLAQWAGKDGTQGYQDTTFFGGELVVPENDPAFQPDYDQLPNPDRDREDTPLKGQRYQWAQLDTGLSPLGYREDGGVIRALSAYPGGAAGSEAYTWFYDLYTWGGGAEDARTPLPRDTVFYPLVRLSETHNYNPSGVLTGAAADQAAQSDVTAEALDAAQKAVKRLTTGQGEESLLTDAQTASANVFSAAQPMAQRARALAQARVEQDAALAEAGQFPEEERPLIAAAPAVKTFRQRLDLLSASRERSQAREDNAEYLIKTLEAVWFTDTLRYPEVKNLDAVVWNNPIRYYNYYWDVDMSAALDFIQGSGIDFDREITVKIQKRVDNGVEEEMWTYSPTASNHTAQLYVQITREGGKKVRRIKILPSAIYARLGDPPFQLKVVTDPAMPINRQYTWTSSNPSVATVDAKGLVTFRGEGETVITVTTTNNRRASIRVVVSPILPVSFHGEPLFNFYFEGPWDSLDGNYAFRPKEQMTRSEVVMLLDAFLNPSDRWQATRELPYVDVTGKERYSEALRRLTGAGVVEGVPGRNFAGEQVITRAEFATMLSRMLELNITDTRGQTHAFADSNENTTWAYAYIDALAKTGVIRGVGGGEFAPSRVLTREESAAILARLMILRLDLSKPDLLVPSDMTPENWSYPSVLRAINTVLYPD